MTEPNPDGVEPISVAELLARNERLGAPAVARRRRRRRGDSDAVSVAELTGEIPVIRDDEPEPGSAQVYQPEAQDQATEVYRTSEYSSGAEEMSPDPPDAPVHEIEVDEFPVDEFPEDGFVVDDSAPEDGFVDESAPEDGLSRDDASVQADAEVEVTEAGATEDAPQPARGRIAGLWQSNLIVLESVLAVAFGAGLFIAFDQLWRWNSLLALVLSVLVILGLVAGVRVVRKTEDIASTLIAVAVGALITLGPLALSLRSG